MQCPDSVGVVLVPTQAMLGLITLAKVAHMQKITSRHDLVRRADPPRDQARAPGGAGQRDPARLLPVRHHEETGGRGQGDAAAPPDEEHLVLS